MPCRLKAFTFAVKANKSCALEIWWKFALNPIKFRGYLKKKAFKKFLIKIHRMERRMRWKSHVRCGWGEKLELLSKVYLFRYVDPRLTKPQIRKIFENLFGIQVLSVNSHLLPTKKKRLGLNQGYKTRYKRIIITIKSDQTIPLFADESNAGS